MRVTSYTIIRNVPTGEIVRIDLKWSTERNDMKDFSINLSILEDEKNIDVYRLDTSHGYIHEHKLWKSLKPTRIEANYGKTFAEKKDEVIRNYARWVALFNKWRDEEYG